MIEINENFFKNNLQAYIKHKQLSTEEKLDMGQ